jgi:hypothetical protein
MNYLPILLVLAGLLVVVAFMAGPGEKRGQLIRNILLTLAALIVGVLLLGVMASR